MCINLHRDSNSDERQTDSVTISYKSMLTSKLVMNRKTHSIALTFLIFVREYKGFDTFLF